MYPITNIYLKRYDMTVRGPGACLHRWSIQIELCPRAGYSISIVGQSVIGGTVQHARLDRSNWSRLFKEGVNCFVMCDYVASVMEMTLTQLMMKNYSYNQIADFLVIVQDEVRGKRYALNNRFHAFMSKQFDILGVTWGGTVECVPAVNSMLLYLEDQYRTYGYVTAKYMNHSGVELNGMADVNVLDLVWRTQIVTQAREVEGKATTKKDEVIDLCCDETLSLPPDVMGRTPSPFRLDETLEQPRFIADTVCPRCWTQPCFCITDETCYDYQPALPGPPGILDALRDTDPAFRLY
jgi:hypothetical protein